MDMISKLLWTQVRNAVARMGGRLGLAPNPGRLRFKNVDGDSAPRPPLELCPRPRWGPPPQTLSRTGVGAEPKTGSGVEPQWGSEGGAPSNILSAKPPWIQTNWATKRRDQTIGLIES